MLKSVVAVFAGFLVVVLLGTGADLLLRRMLPEAVDALGRLDSAPLLTLVIAYSAAFCVLGSHIAARLAPRLPLRHALILGAVNLVLTLAGTIVWWRTAPRWYHFVSLCLILPAAWLGGSLVRERAPSAGAAAG